MLGSSQFAKLPREFREDVIDRWNVLAWARYRRAARFYPAAIAVCAIMLAVIALRLLAVGPAGTLLVIAIAFAVSVYVWSGEVPKRARLIDMRAQRFDRSPLARQALADALAPLLDNLFSLPPVYATDRHVLNAGLAARLLEHMTERELECLVSLAQSLDAPIGELSVLARAACQKSSL